MPDIGDYAEVPVIELYVKVGDSIKVDDAIATLESDKATMDVPAPAAGTVREVKVILGDKVSEGAVIVLLEAGETTTAAASVAQVRPRQVDRPAALERPQGGDRLDLQRRQPVDREPLGPLDLGRRRPGVVRVGAGSGAGAAHAVASVRHGLAPDAGLADTLAGQVAPFP